MNPWRSMDDRAHRLGILDTKLAQGAAMGLTLTAAKLVPDILALDVRVYAALTLLLAIRPVMVYFGPEPPVSKA